MKRCVSKSGLCSPCFPALKRPLMGIQLTSRHVFETAEKCSFPPVVVGGEELQSTSLLCAFHIESGVAGQQGGW